MTSINREMGSYLRRRKGSGILEFSRAASASGGSSWWSDLLSRVRRSEQDDLLMMEDELKAREVEIEQVKELGQELAEDQEREVSLYHRLRSLFSRKPVPDDDEAEFAAAQAAEAAENTPDVQADFRDLAQIQMRWLGRMPSRVMQEFKESEDHRKLIDILQRRGVAKKTE